MSNAKNWKYCFSRDGEMYRPLDAQTKDGALAEARALVGEGDDVWIGECGEPPLPSIDMDWLFEMLNEQATSDIGEAAEDFPDMSPEQSKALEDELNEVLVKHLTAAGQWPPSFFEVHDAERFEAGHQIPHTLKASTVAEVIAALQQLPQDATVSGDPTGEIVIEQGEQEIAVIEPNETGSEER